MKNIKDIYNHKYIELMQSSRIFEGLTEAECIDICNIMKPTMKQYLKNEIIINEGSKFEHVGIIHSGRLAKIKSYYDGKEHLIAMLIQKELIGLETVTSAFQISPVTIYAAEESAVFMFHYHNIINLPSRNEQYKFKLMQNIIRVLANENIKQLYKTEVLSKRSLRERIMTFFYIMQNKVGQDSFHISMNREEFARYLCVNRSALSYELNELKREGVISFHKDFFTINV